VSARSNLLIVAAIAVLACTRAPGPDDASPALPDSSGSFDAGKSPASDAADTGARTPDAAVAGSKPGPDVKPATDAGSVDAGAVPDTAAPLPKVCVPGQQRCEGLLAATCSPTGDGWTLHPCFAGQICQGTACVPLKDNLMIVFDTSGSMGAKVSGKTCPMQTFPNCDPSKGCSRMDVSKLVFGAVLDQINLKTTNLALFRFPQRVGKLKATSCNVGHYIGIQKLTGDTADLQRVTPESDWYWDFVDQILCVPFPRNPAEALKTKPDIVKWMDGAEKLVKSKTKCGNPSATCQANAKCGAGGCCSSACWKHSSSPELRASGGTPIGKTLFYVGEYMRNRVVIDGKACIVDDDCINPNYRCKQGYCTDPARDCRQNVVVLFTDGGENNDPSKFFAPQASAMRLAYGLACKTDGDCVGGATCVSSRCRPAGATGYACLSTGLPCKPSDKNPKSKTFCPKQAGQSITCLPDPTKSITAAATKVVDNVLRSPDGKPFGVRVHVVDISGSKLLTKSFYLSVAGRGRLLTADAADPDQFMAALQSAFDMKNKKVCGTNP